MSITCSHIQKIFTVIFHRALSKHPSKAIGCETVEEPWSSGSGRRLISKRLATSNPSSGWTFGRAVDFNFGDPHFRSSYFSNTIFSRESSHKKLNVTIMLLSFRKLKVISHCHLRLRNNVYTGFKAKRQLNIEKITLEIWRGLNLSGSFCSFDR